MGRSNSAARQRNQRGRLDRRPKGEKRDKAKGQAGRIQRLAIEDTVIPDGMCRRNPRKPKAIFSTEAKASRALEQAQRTRIARGSGYVEKRYYPCLEAEGGCGGYHLTSREAYDPAWKKTRPEGDR